VKKPGAAPLTMANGMLNIMTNNFMEGSSKMLVNKQQKVKTQMNLTGPIPKTIISPKATANKS
jgi:hypothetical protein